MRTSSRLCSATASATAFCHAAARVTSSSRHLQRPGNASVNLSARARFWRTPSQTKFSGDSARNARAMAWPRPPLAPVTTMTRELMRGDLRSAICNLESQNHKMRADGLLVAAEHAHCCCRMLALAQGVDGRDALPRGGCGQAFAQEHLQRQPRAGPALPCFPFLGVDVVRALDSVAQQMFLFSRRQFGPHPFRRLGAALFAREQVRAGNAIKLNVGSV